MDKTMVRQAGNPAKRLLRLPVTDHVITLNMIKPAETSAPANNQAARSELRRCATAAAGEVRLRATWRTATMTGALAPGTAWSRARNCASNDGSGLIERAAATN